MRPEATPGREQALPGVAPGQVRGLSRWLGTIGSDFKWSLSQAAAEQLWEKPPGEGPSCPGAGQHLPSPARGAALRFTSSMTLSAGQPNHDI